jgi:predicted ATPase
MRLERVHIRHLRAFEDVTVDFGDYTCLVGANGAGKSTILCALNVFFRETENTSTDMTRLDREDFFNKDTSKPIEITVTFGQLNEEAQEAFKGYFRNEKLVITAKAVFNEESGRADVKQFGQRLGMEAFRRFFDAEKASAKAADLQAIYAELRATYPDLPSNAKTKDAMAAALRDYEAERPSECALIQSEDQFYGVSKGADRLQRFVQWVYVPAVKDALEESVEAKDTALGRLLARTVRSRTNFAESVAAMREQAKERYRELLDENQSVLSDVSSALQSRLADWAHPDAKVKLAWRQDPEKSVRVEEPWAHVTIGEGDFDGALARLGHGLQRSYIIALLQELAAIGGDAGPRLLLGCEEPELYQHPPQARHLATVLRKLANGNAQVMISTHSPYFVSGEAFEDVRVVRRTPTGATVTRTTFDDVAGDLNAAGLKQIRPRGFVAKLHQALLPSLAEMLFTPRLVLVEGREDAAYIQAHLELSGLMERFRRGGCHIVPTNGKENIPQALAVARRLEIPTFVVFDADGDETNEDRRKLHSRDNIALLRLCGLSDGEPFPAEIMWLPGCVIWPTNLGKSVDADMHVELWKQARDQAAVEFDHASGLDKNPLFIAARLDLAWEAGARSACLQRLCDEIIAFVEPLSQPLPH